MMPSLRALLVVLMSVLLIGTGAAAHVSWHDDHNAVSAVDCDRDDAAQDTKGHDEALAESLHCDGAPCPLLSLGPEARPDMPLSRRLAILAFSDDELIANPDDPLQRPPRA